MTEPKKITQPTINTCISACFAMLMGLGIEEVPNFFHDFQSDENWWIKVRDWLSKYNLNILPVSISVADIKKIIRGYVIVSGISARGHPHATVWKDGELWFDPFPDGDGLNVIETVDVLFPINPLLPVGKAAAN